MAESKLVRCTTSLSPWIASFFVGYCAPVLGKAKKHDSHSLPFLVLSAHRRTRTQLDPQVSVRTQTSYFQGTPHPINLCASAAFLAFHPALSSTVRRAFFGVFLKPHNVCNVGVEIYVLKVGRTLHFMVSACVGCRLLTLFLRCLALVLCFSLTFSAKRA